MARALDNVSIESAEVNGWTILKKKNAKEIEYITKGYFKDSTREIMKTLKRMRVPGGWLYNTSTEITLLNAEGDPISVSTAEAMVYVPFCGATDYK